MSFRTRLGWWLLALSLSCNGSAFALVQPAPATSTVQHSSDETALRALAEAFFNTWAAKDLDGFLRLWSKQSPELEARKKSTTELFASSAKIAVSNLLLRAVKIEGAKASVRVALEATVIEAKTGQPGSGSGKMLRTLHWVKEAGGWKLWREAATVDDFAALLAAAKNDQERRQLLAQEPELKTVELQRALLRQWGRLSQQRKFAEAIAWLEFAQTLAESLDDRTGVALAWRNIGHTYNSQENYRQALAYFAKALTLQDALRRPSQAELLANTGMTHYLLGDYSAALSYAQRGLAIYEELQHREGLIAVLINMAVIYRGQGDYTQALACYQKSLKLLEASGDQEETARLHNNMAVVYAMRGDYRRALEGFQQALKLREALPQTPPAYIADGLLNIGNVHLEQNNAQLALEFYERALALQKKEGQKRDIGIVHNRLGAAHEKLGHREAALEHFRHALALWEAIENKAGIAGSYFALGNFYLGQQNYPTAQEHFQKSLTLYEALGDIEGIVGALGSLSAVHYEQGHYAPALTLLERALPLAEKLDSLDRFAELYRLAGNVHFALGQEALSRQAFEKAIAATETLRTQTAGGEQDRQRQFEDKLDPWRGLIRLLVKQRQYREALVYAEQSRARVLLDVLQSGQVEIRKAMTADEQAQERQLRAEITLLNAQLSRLKQAAKAEQTAISDLQTRLGKARLAYEAFQTSLYAAHPELRAQRGEAPTIRVAELTALLPGANSALLEYVVTDEATYLFVVTKVASQADAGVQVFTLPVKRTELAKQIASFRQQLAGRDLGFRASARGLYQLLLKPAQAQLQGKTNLVIVPDDKLWELPFQALLAAGDRYVIETSAVAYAPSLTVLREMTKARRPTGAQRSAANLLALGNPALGQETIARATLTLRDEKLDPLPEAEAEVKTLGQLYGAARSNIYVGAEAREDRAKSEAGAFRVLHFATHGILNDAAPMYSHLVLAPGDANEDGLLEAWELMQLDLQAELAVLSACETARGRFGAGEGVIGLTWALFVAGVPATVVSQWKVEAASTRDLMLNFHRRLRAPAAQAQTTKVAALRQAALKLMKNPATSHPFYWAGFVLVGDGR